MDGQLVPGDVVKLMNTGKEYQVDEVGVLAPKQVPVRAPNFAKILTKSCVLLSMQLTHHCPTSESRIMLGSCLQGVL